jgi:hypothetical protein
MAKLHELLAAEKTPTAAFNAVFEDTTKKFKNPVHFFDGHSKSLKMINDDAGNRALEDAAREEKPVTTTVLDTLEYAFDLFGKAEDLQYQKNATNRMAAGDVIFRGKLLLSAVPVDELLGLEARLTRIRLIFMDMPTLDATKHWVPDTNSGKGIWTTKFPEDTVKTEKYMTPVEMSKATDKHPAQVMAVNKDVPVGLYTTVKRSGAATALQKAEAIKQVDELMVAVKQARMRANETEAVNDRISETLVTLLLAPLRTNESSN